jgi:hypothetical protein
MNPLEFKADMKDEVPWLALQASVEEIRSKVCPI